MWFRNELSSLAEVSLYYEECNELLIIFYIIDVTSHTLSLFGQTVLDEVANRLSTYQRRRRTYILHCISQRVYKIIRRKTMFDCLLWFQGMNWWLYLEFVSVILQILPVPVAARTAARVLRSWVRIPPRAWMFVCCECCVLSGRGLCDGLIIRSEESYRLWRVVVCDLETS